MTGPDGLSCGCGGWRRTCHVLDGAECDDAGDHVRTEENQVIHVGDHPLGSIAETVHFHHHPEMVLLLVY